MVWEDQLLPKCLTIIDIGALHCITRIMLYGLSREGVRATAPRAVIFLNKHFLSGEKNFLSQSQSPRNQSALGGGSQKAGASTSCLI